jgi:molybdopterin-guanine dinucleotide biosynthesis protein A
MNEFDAFILAGGASTRMGTDKAELLLSDQSFLQRIAGTLREISESITVVGRSVSLPGLKTTTDVYSNWGALGGLHAALHACANEWAFVVACDLPFVTARLITHLAHQRNNHDAVVPIQPDDRPQPLCGFYRVDPCLDQATALIKEGKRRPLDLLERVDTRWVAFSELEELKQSQKFFVNINTPEDYYEAIRSEADTSHHRRP